MAVAVVALIAVFFSAYELLTRSEAKAESHAQMIFVQEAKSRGFSEKSFKGPFLLKTTQTSYEFYWKGEKGDFAVATVQYFPLATEVWFLPPGSKV